MSEQEDKQAKKPRLNLTTSQVAASALAACCASIVASYLGVAGTVIGAAVGSVVATTGAAIYGHLFRTGSSKIKQTLLINGEQVEVEVNEADGRAVEDAGSRTEESRSAVPAGRFYGAEANAATQAADLWHPKTPTAETRAVTDGTRLIPADVAARVDPRTGRTRLGRLGWLGRTSPINRIKKYRKPMGITAAIMAVFAISIVVGIFAGAPVRSVGSPSAPATTTTVTTTVTGQTQGHGGASASSGSTASHSPSGTPTPSASSSTSATASPSSSSSGSPSASSSAGSTATGGTSTATAGKAGGATSTGSPAS